MKEQLRDEVRAEIQGAQSASEFLGEQEEKKKLHFLELNGYFRFRWDLFNNLNGGLPADPMGWYLWGGNTEISTSAARAARRPAGTCGCASTPPSTSRSRSGSRSEIDFLDNVVLGSTPMGRDYNLYSVHLEQPGLARRRLQLVHRRRPGEAGLGRGADAGGPAQLRPHAGRLGRGHLLQRRRRHRPGLRRQRRPHPVLDPARPVPGRPGRHALLRVGRLRHHLLQHLQHGGHRPARQLDPGRRRRGHRHHGGPHRHARPAAAQAGEGRPRASATACSSTTSHSASGCPPSRSRRRRPTGSCPPASAPPSRSSTATPAPAPLDLFLRWVGKKFEIEAEGVGIYGNIGNVGWDPTAAAIPADHPPGRRRAARQGQAGRRRALRRGRRARHRQRRPGPGLRQLPRSLQPHAAHHRSAPLRPDGAPRAPIDGNQVGAAYPSLNNYRFNPAYQVDLILWRRHPRDGHRRLVPEAHLQVGRARRAHRRRPGRLLAGHLRRRPRPRR